MSIGEITVLMRGGVIQVLIMIVPILSMALIVGLIIAIFQATTSIQEQTLTFLPKLVIILLMIALLSGWMFTHLSEYAERLFSSIPTLAK